MSYEEKGAWVYLVATLTGYTGYVAVLLGRMDGVPVADVPYQALMLWTVGIAIGVSIVGRIAIEIAKPSDTHKADARDKEINRFSEYVGGTVLGVAMVGPFALTMFEADHFWIANAMYAAFVLAAIVGTTIKLVAYRRGL